MNQASTTEVFSLYGRAFDSTGVLSAYVEPDAPEGECCVRLLLGERAGDGTEVGVFSGSSEQVRSALKDVTLNLLEVLLQLTRESE